ncbi:MAG: sn-glycerol-3-phosphate ABC transporter ATP-binding protein UgpC [Kiritimatiellae bacterium]|nr:sn-glycerol-3-phosphate ABC transporter ATP-binding protein UgpC [Kiritimatiellia bacterium]
MAEVVLEHVEKIYDNNYKAVHDFNLKVRDKEFVVLVGPSGCGKSTTLRMIAGLEEISGGTIAIDGRVVNNVPPKDRDIAMVFQNYALYPHMSVYDNMAFGLKLRGFKRAEIQCRVNEAAEILGISDLLDRRPKQLSGGQRQRVAVGRAIVRKPKVFLFDEPLSNLDAKMRVQMRIEITRLHHRLGATMIYVTHDQTEAMTMGDRIVVMHQGRVQQVADPLELYNRPRNRFVAGFIGMPPMNFIDGKLAAQDNGFYFENEDIRLPLPDTWRDRVAPHAGRDVTFGVRPEDIGSPAASQVPDAPRLSATVDVIEPMGSETYVYFRAGGQTNIARVEPQVAFAAGQRIELPVMMSKAHLYAAGEEQAAIV